MTLTKQDWIDADSQLISAMHESIPTNSTTICDRPLRIGVVGYSDETKIRDRLKSFSCVEAILTTSLLTMESMLESRNGSCNSFQMVSGLTNLGVPKIAYSLSKKGSHNKEIFTKTVGFACAKAKDFPQFPVDEKHIIGTEWGDESSAFLDYIDGLIRIGDGEQSIKECHDFKLKYPTKPIIEVSDDMVIQWL